uniref:Fucosyltransferase n=1 Tax=Plectus sambesii TaxID=2011161 RepID=A0A914VAG6_9BILA
MTLTYRLDSDVIANYDWMISKQAVKFLIDPPLVYSWDQVLSAVSQKTKLVAELVSNCYTDSKREEYTAELSQFIAVDSYGSCSGIVCEDCNRMLADDYLFYLAFENSVCRDYVTEKVWRMKKLIVPIVLRKSDYINIVPEGSFIAIDQFKSSKDLANYLRYLSVNRTEYLKYFEWTKHFLASSVQNYGYFCELCKTISDDVLPPKVYENIEKWWVEGGNCRVDFAEQFVSIHGVSEKRKLIILLLIVAVALFMTFYRGK